MAARGPLGRPRAPALVDELGDLAGRAARARAAARGSSSPRSSRRWAAPRPASPASENGCTMSRWWPITSAGVSNLRRSVAVRRRCAPKKRPCSTAALGLGRPGARCRGGCRPATAARGIAPRDRRSARISGSPTVSATISGVKASAQPSSALSSTGISITMPRRRSGASEAASSAVLAPSDVPSDHRLVDLEVVEQRDHLARRRCSSSSATCPAGGPSAPWPSRSSVTTRLPRVGQRLRERGVHALVEQQPVDQHVTRGPSPYVV